MLAPSADLILVLSASGLTVRFLHSGPMRPIVSDIATKTGGAAVTDGRRIGPLDAIAVVTRGVL